MPDKNNKIPFFDNRAFLLIIYIIAALSVSYINYESGVKYFGSVKATHYNNYLVCKNSFINLVGQNNIYAPHQESYWDLYKYSPAFAMFMGAFAYMPDIIGLSLWNLLNALILFFAIQSLPLDDRRKKQMILWFLFLELFTNLQYSQTNGMMAGLMIIAFNRMEKGDKALASLFLALSVFIKLFGIAMLPLFLLYPKRIRFIAYTLLWIGLLAWLPLFMSSYEHFIFLYKEWLNILGADYTAIDGLSVIGLFGKFNLDFLPKNSIIIFSALIMYLPLALTGRHNNLEFRLRLAAGILIWAVIFNYRAESPTYIIAMAGAAIWYFSGEKTPVNKFLLVLSLIFTSLSVSDIFPQWLRDEYFRKYLVKAIPCALIWLKIVYDLYSAKYKPEKAAIKIEQ